MSVGRFPFHRGRGGTEVARNLLRRGPPFPASCPMKGDASRLGKRGARLTLSPKGVLCVFRGEKNRKKGRVCGIINTSPFHPRTNKFLHQIYRRSVNFRANWKIARLLFQLFIRLFSKTRERSAKWKTERRWIPRKRIYEGSNNESWISSGRVLVYRISMLNFFSNTIVIQFLWYWSIDWIRKTEEIKRKG